MSPLRVAWDVLREAWAVYREYREAKRAAPKRPAPHLGNIQDEARKPMGLTHCAACDAGTKDLRRHTYGFGCRYALEGTGG